MLSNNLVTPRRHGLRCVAIYVAIVFAVFIFVRSFLSVSSTGPVAMCVNNECDDLHEMRALDFALANESLSHWCDGVGRDLDYVIDPRVDYTIRRLELNRRYILDGCSVRIRGVVAPLRNIMANCTESADKDCVLIWNTTGIYVDPDDTIDIIKYRWVRDRFIAVSSVHMSRNVTRGRTGISIPEAMRNEKSIHVMFGSGSMRGRRVVSIPVPMVARICFHEQEVFVWGLDRYNGGRSERDGTSDIIGLFDGFGDKLLAVEWPCAVVCVTLESDGETSVEPIDRK